MANATPEFKKEFSRLLNGSDEQSRMDCYDTILDSGFKILNDLQKIQYTDVRLSDANILFQTGLLKMIACKRLFEVFEYKSPYNGFRLVDMRDPQSMWNIVRAQFEGFSNFNLLYRIQVNKEFADILYDLWVISGLKNRQNHITTTQENIAKKESERQDILKLVERITSSLFYQSLDADNRRKIDNAVREKDWKLSLKIQALRN